MILRPPRSTRTDTLLPYTTLFRSLLVVRNDVAFLVGHRHDAGFVHDARAHLQLGAGFFMLARLGADVGRQFDEALRLAGSVQHRRSEERRVGKECVSTGRYRWSPYT